MLVNRFDAPIPGESLTRPRKSAPYENPPQYTDIEQAMEDTFDKLISPRQQLRLVKIMEKGVPAEAIARTIVHTGFAKGKWSVDVGLLIARPIMWLVYAIGARNKVKNLKLATPDNDQIRFLQQFDEEDIIEAPTEEEVPADTQMQLSSLLTGNKDG